MPLHTSTPARVVTVSKKLSLLSGKCEKYRNEDNKKVDVQVKLGKKRLKLARSGRNACSKNKDTDSADEIKAPRSVDQIGS